MQAGGYPLPLQTKDGQDVLPVDFVASYQTGEQDSQHQVIVAVDCEMCYTSKALELTRITLVGGDEQVLLDELVLPAEPIVNYNTAFSGITPQMMKGVTTTLSQIQQRVLKFVGPDTLLVGHSLENDLRVLKLVHLKNLDTAILYPHARWPTQQHSLRHLAAMHLKWTIHQGSHDSKIDAIAALRLVKLKLQHGPFFGTSTVSGAQNLMDALHDNGRSCCMLDRPDVLAWHATASCQTQACLSDDQTVAAACECLQQGTADCLWLQLWALADLYEDRAHRKRSKQKWPYPPGQDLNQADTVSRSDCLKRLDAQVHNIYDALQPGSLLLVVTGQGDTTHQRHKEERAKEARELMFGRRTSRQGSESDGLGDGVDWSAVLDLVTLVQNKQTLSKDTLAGIKKSLKSPSKSHVCKTLTTLDSIAANNNPSIRLQLADAKWIEMLIFVCYKNPTAALPICQLFSNWVCSYSHEPLGHSANFASQALKQKGYAIPPPAPLAYHMAELAQQGTPMIGFQRGFDFTTVELMPAAESSGSLGSRHGSGVSRPAGQSAQQSSQTQVSGNMSQKLQAMQCGVHELREMTQVCQSIIDAGPASADSDASQQCQRGWHLAKKCSGWANEVQVMVACEPSDSVLAALLQMNDDLLAAVSRLAEPQRADEPESHLLIEGNSELQRPTEGAASWLNGQEEATSGAAQQPFDPFAVAQSSSLWQGSTPESPFSNGSAADSPFQTGQQSHPLMPPINNPPEPAAAASTRQYSGNSRAGHGIEVEQMRQQLQDLEAQHEVDMKQMQEEHAAHVAAIQAQAVAKMKELIEKVKEQTVREREQVDLRLQEAHQAEQNALAHLQASRNDCREKDGVIADLRRSQLDKGSASINGLQAYYRQPALRVRFMPGQLEELSQGTAGPSHKEWAARLKLPHMNRRTSS
ncbi:hypothetical protein WJX82_000075 [Trebouxia sp. C0006]